MEKWSFWWLFLVANVHLASSASHSLQYFYTALSPGTNFPEFTTVGLVDGEQFVYYVCDKMIPKEEWIKKILDEQCWKTANRTIQTHHGNFKHDMENLMSLINQTTGVHTLQLMYGCELHDDGTETRYWQYGYNGEDFISFDLNNATWTVASNKAVTKQKWETENQALQVKAFLMNECIDCLKKFVEYSRSSLERKVRPEASLFQKNSSSPVVCHATGFFPKAVNITWQKNGEDLHKDVELRETLPNQDGTFQKRSVLTVSPEELNKHNYICIIQHSSLEKEMVLHVSQSGGGSVGVIIGVVVAVLLLVIIGCVGVFIWKKKQSGFKPVFNAPSDGDSLSNNS